METKGTIISISGQVAEVEFGENLPSIHDVLTVEELENIKLEVWESATSSTFYCIILSPENRLKRGMRVINTGSSIAIPVGNQVLGRLLNQ